MQIKKGTLETVDSVYTPGLTGPVKAWKTEDIIRSSDSIGRRPDEEGQERPGGELYLVDSPVQEYCGDDCREKLDKKLTHDNRRGGGGGGGSENHVMEDSFEGSGQVVSLSSCRDNQLAWESSDGKSLTQVSFGLFYPSPLFSFLRLDVMLTVPPLPPGQFFIEQLRKQSHPTFAQLIKAVSHDLHKAAVDTKKDKRRADRNVEEVGTYYKAAVDKHHNTKKYKKGTNGASRQDGSVNVRGRYTEQDNRRADRNFEEVGTYYEGSYTGTVEIVNNNGNLKSFFAGGLLTGSGMYLGHSMTTQVEVPVNTYGLEPVLPGNNALAVIYPHSMDQVPSFLLTLMIVPTVVGSLFSFIRQTILGRV
ncbi:hypothetical protein K435DRAFT_52405 [Dendrothele bispora CBS 962.96]|uniref:Uncharacterized protein n=1 Tax=Dendrothele bispora (strain CBS 962.96) TaxID=1314807 RepID=A0A4S8M6C5_DENBC|nr:hypothetical protein K435DRAFT_52405 [Dendrothele bispora CBS 962.96]